jgi:hypothetical protein
VAVGRCLGMVFCVKRQGWGESCRIRLWEREAYVLKGARTSPKGEVRESKHAVEPGANSTGPCGRPHGRHSVMVVTIPRALASGHRFAVEETWYAVLRAFPRKGG